MSGRRARALEMASKALVGGHYQAGRELQQRCPVCREWVVTCTVSWLTREYRELALRTALADHILERHPLEVRE